MGYGVRGTGMGYGHGVRAWGTGMGYGVRAWGTGYGHGVRAWGTGYGHGVHDSHEWGHQPCEWMGCTDGIYGQGRCDMGAVSVIGVDE